MEQIPSPRGAGARGQALVEFMLVLPIMLLLLLAIIDFGRVYTTMISVESAAREAADYGTTLGAGKWQVETAMTQTVPEMEKRACVAASNLPDYVGSGGTCTNPSFDYCVTASVGGECLPLNPADGCDDPTRASPCTVTVTLTYEFHLIMPVNIEIMGSTIGFPSVIELRRDSTFAITDIDLSPGAP
jgi:Flp pilus assembly protein TadG